MAPRIFACLFTTIAKQHKKAKVIERERERESW